MGPMGPRVGRGWVARPTVATHPGGATETTMEMETTETTKTTETTETAKIPTPTTPHTPAPRDEIIRSGHPSPLTLTKITVEQIIARGEEKIDERRRRREKVAVESLIESNPADSTESSEVQPNQVKSHQVDGKPNCAGLNRNGAI